MEFSEVINTQFAFHGIVVGLVLVCAVLVFVFGFKSVEEFPFDKLTNAADDRKPAGKKRKVKDKKVQSNGHATTVGNDKGDLKQKIDNVAAKGNSAKSATKDKRDPERVLAKELTKAAGKQEKKQTVKPETSPNKSALKESKNIKDNKKNITDESQKQVKEKKVDSSEKGITKIKQVVKNKGKENVEVKNIKNTEKASQKVKLVDDKPKDDDEGEWEQAVYRKDKKKKTATTDDELISDKAVKKDVSSPSKKKKSKSSENTSENNQLTIVDTPLAEVTPVSVDTEQVKPECYKHKEQKQAKKEVKKDKVKPSEEIVKETELPSVDTEGDAKSGTKKKKKKSGKENVENNVLTVEKEGVLEEPVVSITSKSKKVEIRATVEAKPASSETKSEVSTENTAVFDELGDVWKEAKAPKKSNKKKVRKDQ